MSKNGTTRRQNDEIKIRFKSIRAVPASTLGLPAPPPTVLVPPNDDGTSSAIVGMIAQLIEQVGAAQVLLGIDIFDQPWVLVGEPKGSGWVKLRTNPFPEGAAEEEEKKSDIVTGPQAIDAMNRLPGARA